MSPIEIDHLLIANNIQNMEIENWNFSRNDTSMFEISHYFCLNLLQIS